MVLALQLISCAIMFGVIWFVQLIAYPAFHFVEPNRFVEYHRLHSNRITAIVGPVMLLELATAIALAMTNSGEPWTWVNLGLVLFLWGWTGIVSVPIHNQLIKGYAAVQVDRLVATNWPRTLAWSARLAVLFYLAIA